MASMQRLGFYPGVYTSDSFPCDRKLSICPRDAPQEEQAFDIVDEVRQSDLRLRSRDPDGPDEQTHPILLLGKDMLDARTDFGFGVVGAPDRFRRRAPLRPLTMDMADEAGPFHELLVGGRSVSGVRPDAARPGGLGERSIAQTAALGGGVLRAPFANEAETAIERDVVPIAEDRNRQIDRRRRAILARLGLGVFDCPARVAILLAKLRGLVFPVGGDAPVLDRLLLVLGVALTRSGDQARIDD